MKKPRFLATGIGAILALVPVTLSAATKSITASAGNGTSWGVAGSWGGAGLPGTEDEVIMRGSGFINISGSAFAPAVTSTSIQDLTFNGTGGITLQNADTIANMNLILNGLSFFIPLISTTNGQTYTIQNGTVSNAAFKALTLTLGASGLFDVASGGNLNISSNITQDASERYLMKTGKGTLLLGGTNSFTGITTGDVRPALTIEEGKVTLSGSLATGSQIVVAPVTYSPLPTSLLDITANSVNPYTISVAARGTFRLGTGGLLGGTTSTINLTGAASAPGFFGGIATANIDSTTGSRFTMNVNNLGVARINPGGRIGLLSTVNVNSGGIITGTGTVSGTTTINAGGLIQSGSSGVGTLTFENLTFANGATRIQTTTNSKIVTTALTVNGGAGSVSIDIPSISSNFSVPQTITLLDYATIAGGAGTGAFVLGQIPNRTNAVLNFSNGTQVDLTINGVDFPVWTGALDQVWTTGVQGNPENWALNSNSSPTDFRTRDIATFTDSGNATVTIGATDVSPAGVVFTNTVAKNYLVTGSSAIAGAGGITKSGTGRTEIVTVNTFTGAVTISGGTLAAYALANAGSASSLGAGIDISISDATLEYTGSSFENKATDRPIAISGAAAVRVGMDHDVTLSGTISGSGSLTKAGLGTLIISGENSYAGNTVISQGVLQVGDVSATGTLGAGTSVTNDGELIFDIPGDSNSPHGISGSGILRKRGIGTLTVSGPTPNSYTGGTFIEGGTLLAAKSAVNATIPGAMTLAFGGGFLLGAADQIANTAVVTIDGGAFGSSAASFPDTFARIDLNTGDFSTGATLTGVNLTNRLQITNGTAMISSGGAMTAKRVDVHLALADSGTLIFDGGSTVGGQESKLTVGTDGLFLNGATVSFNAGNGAQSVVGGSSVGSILALGGTLTATGTNVFQKLGVAGPKANLDLLGANRTINVVGANGSLTLGTTAAPVNATNGGITKTGLGTLELPGTQTFAAASFVNAGKLVISGPVSATALTIGDLATLEGTGSVGTAATHTVTVANGGTITVGDDNGLGTLNFRKLVLGATGGNLSTLNFSFTSDPVGSTAKTTVFDINGLVPNGGTNSVSVNVSGVVAGVGFYNLIKYSGAIGGVGASAFTIGSTPNRVTAELRDDTANSVLQLRVISAANDVWSGAFGTQWVSQSQPNPKNWTLSTDASAVDFSDNDVVVFDDTAVNTTVGINTNDVQPAAIRFRNNTSNYSFTGSKGISGTTNLVMEGTGIVDLFTSNSFTGVPTFKSGTVRIGALNDIGVDGGVGAGAKLIFDGGKLDVNSVAGTSNRPITMLANGGTIATDGGLTLSGAISGAGRLTKGGSGVLSLIGANGAFTGKITVAGGRLQFIDAASIGTISQEVTLSGGTLEYNSGALLIFADAANPRKVIVGPAGGGISVPTGAVSDTGGLWFSLDNALSGSGPLTKSGDSVLRLTTPNATLFSNWTVTEGPLETRVDRALGFGSVTLTGDTLTGKIGTLVAQNMTVSNNIIMNGGALGTRSGDATVYSGNVNIIGPSFVRMHSFTTTTSPQNIGITGVISGNGSLTTVIAANTVSTTKALTISNNTNNFSGTFGITKDQILLAQAAGGVGKTLGSSTVELTGGILRIRDNGTGSNQNLTTYNTNNIVVQPLKDGSNITLASTSTIDVDRAAANTTNKVRLGGLTINADPDPAPAKLTTLNLIGANGYTVEFDGASSFNGNAAITSSNSSVNPTFNGVVSGSGILTMPTSGRTLTLTNPGNDFSGSFILPAGAAILSQSSLPGFTGKTLGTATISLAGTAALRIRDNGTGSSQTLNYGNNVAITGTGATIDVARVNSNTGNTINLGSLSVGGTLNVASGNSYKLGFNGPTTLTAATTINAATSADISLNGAVSGTVAITKTGAGRLALNEVNSFIDSGGVSVAVNGGSLGGTGFVPGHVTLAAGTTMAPGLITTAAINTGIFSAGGNVTFNGTATVLATFAAELGRGLGSQPIPGEYDQLRVGTGVGNVSTGGITLTNATLALTAPGGLQNTDIFFIMINDGIDAVNGIFTGRPQGSSFVVNGYNLSISYTANFATGEFAPVVPGNDIAIMVPEPTGVALLLGGLATVLGRRRRR